MNHKSDRQTAADCFNTGPANWIRNHAPAEVYADIIDRIESALAARSAAVGCESGAVLISRERERQVSKKGWSPSHDDEHDGGEMVMAAICYAIHPSHPLRGGGMPHEWPWSDSAWKPSPRNRVKELTKAGALIAAEIDRLQRATLPKEPNRA